MRREEQKIPQIELLTPLRGEFYPDEPDDADGEYDYEWAGEMLDGADLVPYQEAIQAMVDRENNLGTDHPSCNLMDYFYGEDTIREKVKCAVVSVKKAENTLYGCTTLTLQEFLEEPELKQLCEYITGQYSDGWGERFEQRDIKVDGGILHVHFYQKEPVQIQEKTEAKIKQDVQTLSQKYEETPAHLPEKQKKYEITDICHPKYPWLRRIRALVRVNEQVEAGTLGGFVESEANLSQDGGCWIYDKAICCGEAVVEKEAGMFDGTLARDSALVTGDACLFDRAAAEGQCCIRSGEIKDRARVAGDAVISESILDGLSPLIAGDSHVYGEVRGRFVVKDLVLPGEKLVNPTADLFILENRERHVLVKTRELKPPKDYPRSTKKKKELER